MIYDFLSIMKDSDIPIWRQLYSGMSEALSDGRIDTGSKLPSIRELSHELGISRSPVENAYIQLQIDGLIESRPKSGYFAAFLPKPSKGVIKENKENGELEVMYDFSAGRIDAKIADIDIWRRHLRSALNMHGKIISYGDAQGEPELREALVDYCYAARGVKTEAEKIVIASGTQQLLTLLCRIFGRGGNVAMERPGFVQGEQIFIDFGWNISFLRYTDDDIAEVFKECKADLFADITSNRPQISLSKFARRRKELISWAARNHTYILEDDYNGELRYVSRPMPSLQGMAPERVIYIGSFSRLLLPSVRIAYMALPEDLAIIAREKIRLYDQTSSKVEQLALAEYIKERHLERHLRRSRKIYQAKSREVLSALADVFGERVECTLFETSMSVAAALHCDVNGFELREAAKKHKILTDPICPSEEGLPRVSLSFSGIPLEDIRPAVAELGIAWSVFLA